MSRLLGAVVLMGCLTAARSARSGPPDDAGLTLLGEGYELYTVEPGARFCIDRDYTLGDPPPEVLGCRAIRTRMSEKDGTTIAFKLDRPARMYVVFQGLRLLKSRAYGQPPEGWTLYLPGFSPKLGDRPWDIYYRRFPAGPNKLTVPCSTVCLGVKAIGELTPREQLVPGVCSGDRRITFSPRRPVTVDLCFANVGEAPVPVAVDLSLKRADGKLLETKPSAIHKVAPGDSRVRVDFGTRKPGLHRLEARFTWAGNVSRTIDYPVFVSRWEEPPKPVHDPSVRVYADVRAIDDVGQDPERVHIYMTAVAELLRVHNVRGAYVNGNHSELDIFARYGLSVVMDSVEVDPPDRLADHPALRAWFHSQVVDRKNPTTTRDELQRLAEGPFKDRPLLYKPMSFVAEHLGSGAAGQDPLLLWRQLEPPIRTVRCTAFSGGGNVLHRTTAGNALDYPTLFVQVERAAPTPWWFMVSTYGQRVPRGRAAGKHCPTGPELSALVHCALARGAGNLFCYRAINGDQGIIDPTTVAPAGSALAGLHAIGSFLDKTHTVLGRLGPGRVRAVSDRPEVLVVARGAGPDEQYLYVVNLDDSRPHEATLTVFDYRSRPRAPARALTRAARLAGQTPLDVAAKAEGRTTVRLSLGPGEGDLVRLHFEPD